MNTKIFSLLAIFVLLNSTSNAQVLNWADTNKQNKHIINVNIGLRNGLQYGAGYGYKINNKLFPFVLYADYTALSGNMIFDDYKARLGGNIRWISYHNFQLSTGIYGVFRHYRNDFVKLGNFGSDMNVMAGYYRKKWFMAGEAGFDKAIVTHFRHSEAYKAQYAGVVDGWYETSTGGNFYYGLHAGFSFKHHDIWLKAGKSIEQDFKTRPLVPIYGQLGFNLKF
jgi:hypothetical protein